MFRGDRHTAQRTWSIIVGSGIWAVLFVKRHPLKTLSPSHSSGPTGPDRHTATEIMYPAGIPSVWLRPTKFWYPLPSEPQPRSALLVCFLGIEKTSRRYVRRISEFLDAEGIACC